MDKGRRKRRWDKKRMGERRAIKIDQVEVNVEIARSLLKSGSSLELIACFPLLSFLSQIVYSFKASLETEKRKWNHFWRNKKKIERYKFQKLIKLWWKWMRSRKSVNKGFSFNESKKKQIFFPPCKSYQRELYFSKKLKEVNLIFEMLSIN